MPTVRFHQRSTTVAVSRTQVGDYVIYGREASGSAGSPVVVLVHGFLVSGRYMVPTLQALAPTCRALAPDLPGWGHSQKPSKGRSLTLGQMADALAEWTASMGAERPVYLGNSFGCQIIVELAIRQPERLSAAILLGPTVDPRARKVIHQAYRLALDGPREKLALWLIELRDLLYKGVPRTVRELRVMMDDRVEEKLPRVSVPTLVVRGSHDPIAPAEWAERAARLLPRGSLLTIPGAPHCANYSTPDRLADAITPFIMEHAATRPSR